MITLDDDNSLWFKEQVDKKIVCIICGRRKSDLPNVAFFMSPPIRALQGRQVWADVECRTDLVTEETSP